MVRRTWNSCWRFSLENPRYSASNVLLAMEQNPEITYINSLKGWNELGRSVKREETGLKVRVSDPYIKDGREYRGYKVGRVFDISQTTGKGTVPKLTIRENTAEMDTALRKLLDQSPVKVVTSTALYEDARYDPASQEITVSANLTDTLTFAALAREIVHAQIHDHGRYPYYSRNDCALEANSVSYMLCRSFGIQAKQPDASRIALYVQQIIIGEKSQDLFPEQIDGRGYILRENRDHSNRAGKFVLKRIHIDLIIRRIGDGRCDAETETVLNILIAGFIRIDAECGVKRDAGSGEHFVGRIVKIIGTQDDGHIAQILRRHIHTVARYIVFWRKADHRRFMKWDERLGIVVGVEHKGKVDLAVLHPFLDTNIV